MEKERKLIIVGVSSTFTVEDNVVELELHVVSQELSGTIYGVEILPKYQEPLWDGVKGIEAPEEWNFKERDAGVMFFTTTKPLLRCQRVKLKFKVYSKKISGTLRVHLIDKNQKNIGMAKSTKGIKKKKTLEDRIKELRKIDPKLSYGRHAEHDAVLYIMGTLSAPMDIEKLKKQPHFFARKFFAENKELFNEIDEKTELKDGQATTDRLGMTHVALNQKYGEASVLGGMVSVHFKPGGVVYLLNSSLEYKIDAQKAPKIEAGKAQQIAFQHAGKGASIVDHLKPELTVARSDTLHLKKTTKRYYLCWKVHIEQYIAKEPAEWVYFIDAITGETLSRYNGLLSGTATGYYSKGTAFNSVREDNTYKSRDEKTTAGWNVTSKPKIHTYDNAGSIDKTITNYRTDADDIWGDDVGPERKNNERPIVDVHRYVGYVLSYFYLKHSQNSWNNAGADVKANVHYGENYNNAKWSGDYDRLLIGDGDDEKCGFTSALDVVAHEFTHGVNKGFEIVQGDSETGALNEAIADCFACFASLDYPAEDSKPWVIGEKIVKQIPHLRNLEDPGRDAYGEVKYDTTSDITEYDSCKKGYCPDHYSIKYNGKEDDHGIHINCTIIGHAICLMVNGGTHRLSSITVTGIGPSPVEEILYHVISTGYLSNTSQFADFRRAMILACMTLFPGNLDYLITVKKAFKAVGIGPDLYVRDVLEDTGEEPGIQSCMSPDIINRKQKADYETLKQINDMTNDTLCQNIEWDQDNYVYFRIFNCGSFFSSCTFRLFISPASTFCSPATWREVGHRDTLISIKPGGSWMPEWADQCIVFPKSLINSLGKGHYCFIGIIECAEDPAPDRTLIGTYEEFYDFIRKSNNYAWRNCDIMDDVPIKPAPIYKEFVITGFGAEKGLVEFEVDARNLPEDTELQILVPIEHSVGTKFSVIQNKASKLSMLKIPGVLLPIPVKDQRIVQKAQSEFLVKPEETTLLSQVQKDLAAKAVTVYRIEPCTITRLSGFYLNPQEQMKIGFTIKFSEEVRERDVYLAFRQIYKDDHIGQMNYIFKLRSR